MKKFIKKNALFLSALFMVIIIIIIIALYNRPTVNYKVSRENLLSMLNDSTQFVSPFEIESMLAKNKGKLVLVDIRPADEFFKGHIEGAVNIPVMNLLDRKVLGFFNELSDDGQEVVLYGDDQLQANGPWLLLKQVGISNLKILRGGYQLYKMLPLPDSLMNMTEHLVLVEKSRIDTASLRKKENAVVMPVAKTQKVQKEKIVPVKKEESAGGGC